MREIFEATLERLLGDLSTAEVVLACEGGHWPAALWDAVEDSGFALAAAPEALGGAGASWEDLYVVLTACGRHNAPVPLPEALLANWLLGQAGLPAVTGPLSVAADATLSFVDGHVSGSLKDVPWGRHLTHVVALANDAGRKEVVLLATALAKPGGQRLNTAGEPRDDLVFEHARPVAVAPCPAPLPPDVMLQGCALLRAAQTAGALQAALAMCTRYATERVQFGKPIGSFQAIGQQIAVLAEHVALASVSAEAACCDSGPGGLALLRIAAAKVLAAEAATVAAGIAHAVHGAIGFTHEHQLHLTTRRLWAWRSEYGSSTFWSQRIGRAVCAGGAATYWPALTAGVLPAMTQGETR
jgi:acyl-CoA dehydrogenase